MEPDMLYIKDFNIMSTINFGTKLYQHTYLKLNYTAEDMEIFNNFHYSK